MTQFILLTIMILIASPQVFAQQGNSCLATLNKKEIGAPFSVVARKNAVAEVKNILKEGMSDLDDSELVQIIMFLEQPTTEVYVPYDSGDMGGFLHIVKTPSCNTLWSGFIYYN